MRLGESFSRRYNWFITLSKFWERIPERSFHNILPMDGLAGKITSSLHESHFACYKLQSADEYSFTSYNCISNITISGRTVEEDYPKCDRENTVLYCVYDVIRGQFLCCVCLRLVS